MARYIDADKLKNALSHYGKEDVIFIDEINMYIDDTPTVDVAEVQHGEWVETTELLGCRETEVVGCTICGETFIPDEDCDADYFRTFFNYCPCCGAKMDGGEIK
jgi:hypothetical protein